MNTEDRKSVIHELRNPHRLGFPDHPTITTVLVDVDITAFEIYF